MPQSIESSLKILDNLIINHCFVKVSEKIKQNLESCQIFVADIYAHREGDILRIKEEFVSTKDVDQFCL